MDDRTIGLSRAPAAESAPQASAKPYANSRRTSVLLREYMANLDQPKASLGSLRDALGDRGFGILLFIFALPNLIPVNIPLLSAVLGAPLVLLAAQLTYGRHKPWFPDWLARQSVSRANFDAVVNRALPYLERAERWLRPRLSVLLSWTGERVIGLGLLVLTVVLALPIPFGNWLPAFAICIIGLAMVEKDGLAVLAGFAVGAFSLVVAGTVVIGLLKAFLLLLSGISA
ncbi:exopolysaccharide biosynthesis protein [Methyloceanibacter sp.]|uniref:exopolysaccharide biosynthesis protein n=1 Tax=Methyloceanibacter sp. TaxID=1965321 RepID=UPI003D6C7CC4